MGQFPATPAAPCPCAGIRSRSNSGETPCHPLSQPVLGGLSADSQLLSRELKHLPPHAPAPAGGADPRPGPPPTWCRRSLGHRCPRWPGTGPGFAAKPLRGPAVAAGREAGRQGGRWTRRGALYGRGEGRHAGRARPPALAPSARPAEREGSAGRSVSAGGARGGGARPGPRLSPGAPPPQLAASESGSRGALCPASFPPPFGACHPRGAGTRGWTQAWPGPPPGETGPRRRGRAGEQRCRSASRRLPSPRRRMLPGRGSPASSAPAPGPLARGALGSTRRGSAAYGSGEATAPGCGVSSLAVAFGEQGNSCRGGGGGWVEPSASWWLQRDLLRGGERAAHTAHAAEVVDASRPRPAPRAAGTLWARLGLHSSWAEAVFHVT